MSGKQLTIDDLKRILREGSGESDGVDLDGDIIDIEFADLGYDSIAILETGGRIERECGVALDDESVTTAKTPRALLDLVNDGLAKV